MASTGKKMQIIFANPVEGEDLLNRRTAKKKVKL
jgi:hypothetical protein